MQGDPGEERRAAIPQTEVPPGPPRPEQPSTQPNYPVYSVYPPYSQQPYFPAPPIYMPPPGPMPRKGPPWYAWVIGGCLVLLLLVSGSCVALGLSIGNLFQTLANEETATDTSTQTFAVEGAPTIVVRDASGDITIQTGDASSVQVQTLRHASDTTSQAAQGDLADIEVSQAQSGNTITLEARISGATSLTRLRSADFIVTVPAAATFDLETTDGDVTTQGVTLVGSSRIVVPTGAVDLSGALGSGASLEIQVNTGSASLTLPGDTSAHLDASTSTGSIDVTGWSIPVTQHGPGAQAAGDLGTTPQAQVTIRVTSGDIELSAG